MKKNLFIAGLAIMGLFSMTSCSSSDDDKKESTEVTIQDSE